jgi:tetratricopeptide (TPR) repeat protein
MTNAREYGSLLETVAPRFSQSPQDCLLRMDYVAELCHVKRYEEAFGLLAEDLAKDDNDADLYQWAVTALARMNGQAEAIQLLELWRDKHPDNQEAWIARGSGWANTVTDEGWRLMRERMAEAVKAATRATEIAPQDCRTWTALLACGTGAPLPREKMEDCFTRILALNPQHYPAYAIYANYLKPKWFGSEARVQAFVEQYQEWFPVLTYDVVREGFWDRGGDPTDEASKRAMLARQADQIRQSAQLGKFEARMRDNLVTAAEGEAFDGRSAVVRLRGSALQDLVRADPANWAAWNLLAQFQVRQGLRKDAGISFARIGTHWVPFVWDKASFEKARGQAVS